MVILQSLCAGGQNLTVVDGEIEGHKGREDSQGKFEIVCMCACLWTGFEVNILFLSYSSVQGACPSSWCNCSPEYTQLGLVVGYQ